MTLLGLRLPIDVDVLGRRIPINASHHCGFRIAALLDNPSLQDDLVMTGLLANYYPGHVPSSAEEQTAMLDAAITFFSRGECPKPAPRQRRKKTKGRLLDWEADAARIIADFQRFYGIDLSDAATHVHWWRFMALFDNLPGDTSQIMQAMGVRAREVSDCTSKEERAWLRARKKAVALPPRTAAEIDTDM